MKEMQVILYVIQVLAMAVALICTLIMTIRMKKAIDYMGIYIREHQNKKGVVSREFKKVIKILGGR